ncbi:MAG: TlpA disulfide reductase family protein [Planctomycetaceae bacterium]|nr:TlpA family protein disulfide reductase [Planctomycetaceae bacterium]MDG2387900.1 TlpA disulfide reductase family protein [Planctomycetaceae bacterium]
MRQLLIIIGILLLPVSVMGAEALEVSPEERTAIRDVQKHLQQSELDAAEEALEKQLVEFPDSARIHALHMNFAYAYRRMDDHAAAFRHMEQLVKFYLSATAKRPELYQQMANALDAMSGYGLVAKQSHQVEQRFETILTMLKNRTASGDDETDTRLIGAVHDVRLRMINFLIGLKKYDDADRYLMEELQQAKEEYEKQSDSADFVLRLANALQSRVTLRDVTGADDLDDARHRQLVFLELKAKEFQDHPEILAAYLDAHLTAINALSRSHPDRASELLKKSRDFINSIESEERVITQKVMIAKRSLPYLQQLVIDGQRHAKLLETDWTPPQAISWINSEPLTESAFAGKVVLLDFWSVWCIPCLESFPHLSRWYEQYQEEGLVVVGVTRFYNYAWDDQRDQIAKELDRDVPQKEELEVLKKYARQKALNYPLAITGPQSEFQQKYHVVSLPQIVLIGRDGKIHMVRIGTGPTIAREIERKIEELLAEEEVSADSKNALTTATDKDNSTADSTSEKETRPNITADESPE